MCCIGEVWRLQQIIVFPVAHLQRYKAACRQYERRAGRNVVSPHNAKNLNVLADNDGSYEELKKHVKKAR